MTKNNVGPSVIKQLRARWFKWWGKDWPHDDAFLKELWCEARGERDPRGMSKRDLEEVYVDTLDRMCDNM